ncbi:MAG: glycosyltransferase [Caulobacteraceae bacterium]|nr:glycosyltransferase [Caulobacteraceae bacterium]
MKILDVSGFYSETGGGVASYVRQKLAFAAREGHEVVVVAPGAESREELRPGGKIVWVSAPPMPFDANYRMFLGAAEAWRVMDSEAPDVVEGSSPWRGGWIAAQWPGDAVRSLVFHQDFIAGYPHTLLDGLLDRDRIDRLFNGYWAYLRRLSANFDVTVTGGEWLAERLERFGVHRPVAVPFGIEADLFSPAQRNEALRRELLAACGAGSQSRLLLTVGRLHPEKRHRTVIEGFVRARADRPDIVLLVIGDGPTRGAVERLVRRSPGVHLMGPVTDRRRLAEIYASADLLVHGSGAETYGLVVAEAMSSGLPVVAPDTGGAADLARRGAAVTYRTGDAASCAAAICEALRSPAATGGAGAASGGPSSAEAHFVQLFALYRDLVDERATRRVNRAA